MNLIAGFLDKGASVGPRPAIVTGAGETISYDQLALRSGRLAALLRRQGVLRGDRVLLALPIGIELYLAIAALWRLGAVIVFPEPAMGISGVRRAVEIAAPSAMLVGGIYRLLPLLVPQLWGTRRLGFGEAEGDPLEAVGPEHPALLSFTSGSTGRPKAIVRSHGFLAAQNAALHDLIVPRRDDETDLVAFPVFVIANLSLGTTSVLPNWRLTRHDAADGATLLRHLAAHRVTRAMVPPVIAELLADTGGAPLDVLFTGGGPVFPDLIKRLVQVLPRTDIVTVYGSTEAEPIAHQHVGAITAAEWQQMEAGAGILAGTPVPAVQLELVADEIIVTGPHVNQGYLDGIGDADNKLTRHGEIWHRTGDAGRLDATGKLWLRGRLSAAAAGHYPFEVETVARQWPGVRRAALVPGREPMVIALEGEEPAPGRWTELAEGAFGGRAVKVTMPLDRRHRSKVDYVRLK